MRRVVTLAGVLGLVLALVTVSGVSAAGKGAGKAKVRDRLPGTIVIGATSEKTGPVPVPGDDSARIGPAQLKKAGTDPLLIRTSTDDASFKSAIQSAISHGSDGLWFTECTPAAISAVGDAQNLGFSGKIFLENCLASFGV